MNIDGTLLNPEKRWGGIMRKLDATNFEQSNIEYIQFWLLNPFLDEEVDNKEGGDLYFNLGEVSEDILKDGYKSYETDCLLMATIHTSRRLCGVRCQTRHRSLMPSTMLRALVSCKTWALTDCQPRKRKISLHIANM